MYRIDNASSADAPPPPTPLGKPEGYFQGGNPATAQLATIVEAEWLNMMQEEGTNLVLSAGLALDKADRTQWAQAIDAKIAAGVGGMPMPFVLKAGDTMTGPLDIQGTGRLLVTSGQPSITLHMPGVLAPGMWGGSDGLYVGGLDGQGTPTAGWFTFRADGSTQYGNFATTGTMNATGNILTAGHIVADGTGQFGSSVFVGQAYVPGDFYLEYNPTFNSTSIVWSMTLNNSMTMFRSTNMLDIGMGAFQNCTRVDGNSGAFSQYYAALRGNSSPNWDVPSDSSLKQNVADYTRGLTEVCQLHPITFEYNGMIDYTADGKTHVGLIAEEVATIFPDMVTVQPLRLRGDDTAMADLAVINVGELHYAFINAIKELAARLTALESGAAA